MDRRAFHSLVTAGLVSLTATGTARAASPHGEAAAEPVRQDLAVRGQGFPEYRIPALTTSTRGTLLAAFDGRPTLADVPGNIAVVLRRSTDGGRTWGPQRVVRGEPAPKGFGDPSLLTDRTTGRIFLFYVASVNQGFTGSHTGTDENDPDVLQTDYSYSDDDGLTWRHRRITAMIKDPSWGGVFAASGEGVQLRHGPYRGRLLQQYVVRKDGANYAVSVHSDDHGETWHTGSLVGPGGDENKTAELSDGTVLLNNRSAPCRTLATSTDGGVTYTPFTPDPQLPDPANNGSLLRYAPDARPGDPRARRLLFSNTEDPAERRNLTVKMSLDDGRTWPVRKVVDAGAAGYSTLTRLPDGRVGLFYERGDYRYLTFLAFGLSWLGGGATAR